MSQDDNTQLEWRSVQWPDGSIYEGLALGSRCHSHGILMHANGDRYEGQFAENKPNGYGVYIWNDGTLYRGEWMEGYMHGCGVKLWRDPSTTSIQAQAGKFVGDKYAGPVMSCTEEASHNAAVEADVAAQRARTFGTRDGHTQRVRIMSHSKASTSASSSASSTSNNVAAQPGAWQSSPSTTPSKAAAAARAAASAAAPIQQPPPWIWGSKTRTVTGTAAGAQPSSASFNGGSSNTGVLLSPSSASASPFGRQAQLVLPAFEGSRWAARTLSTAQQRPRPAGSGLFGEARGVKLQQAAAGPPPVSPAQAPKQHGLLRWPWAKDAAAGAEAGGSSNSGGQVVVAGSSGIGGVGGQGMSAMERERLGKVVQALMAAEAEKRGAS